jgi:ATP-binding cassette subfamily B protein
MKWGPVVRKLAAARPGPYIVSGLFSSVLFYLFPLVPGLIAKLFFDRLEAGAAAAGLWILVLLLIVADLGRIGSLAVAAASQNSLVVGSANLLRRNLLSTVLGRVLNPRASVGTGETVSRLRNDVEEVSNFVRWTADPVGQAAVVAVALTILASVDVIATVVVCLPLLVVLATVSILGERIERYRRSSQETIAEVSDTIGEMFGNVTAVKVGGAEQRLIERFERINERRRKSKVRDLFFEQGLTSIFANASHVATAVVLMLMAARIGSDQMSVGDLALFVSYMAWLSMVAKMFGSLVTNTRRVKVSIERLESLSPERPKAMLGSEPEPWLTRQPRSDAENSLRALRVEGVTSRYPGSSKGVFDIDLELHRGSLTVITGRIGSGKTTLLRVVLGILGRQEGEVRWNGAPIDPSIGLAPPRAGYVPQRPRLFSGSLSENLLLGWDADAETVEEAIARASLEPDVAGLSHGLDTDIGTRGVKLSGGQVRRTAYARMLVRRPELLVIDDLSSALDTITEEQIWARFTEHDDATRLVVSHRRSALAAADQVIVMKDGRIDASGKLSEVLQSSAEMRLLWETEVTTA